MILGMDPKLTFLFGILATVIGALIKELWSASKSDVKSLRTALDQNTLAVQGLTIEMKYVHEKLEVIPELRKDIDGLGEKVRSRLTQ